MPLIHVIRNDVKNRQKFVIIVKPGTCVNKHIKRRNTTKFEGSTFRNGFRNAEIVKIDYWVIMHILTKCAAGCR